MITMTGPPIPMPPRPTAQPSYAGVAGQGIVPLVNTAMGYLDDIARANAENPGTTIGVEFLFPGTPLGDAIYAAFEYVVSGSKTGMNTHYQQSQQPQQDAPPPVNMRDAFLVAMRDSGMFPQASDATVTPVMLASLARCYLIGRVDALRSTPGGWQQVEAFHRDYQFVLQQGWVPDQSWKWWAAAPQAAPFRMQGNVGSALANHMAAPPVWG